jgi:DNA-binding NtrC family response regulator
MPVIVLTAFGSIPGAVDAIKLGAFDYLTKPLSNPQALRDLVQRALHAGPHPAGPSPLQVVAESPAMKQVLETVGRAASRETTILLLGESGTGKEVLARLIHESGPRKGHSFIAVNCAALAEPLLESELFGHEKGAFTGALGRHPGKFEQAHRGTLFLDEIAETSPALQAKLLRVLQERTLIRVGGTQEIKVDVRIVSATNKDLQQQVQQGLFREDLYYRLAVLVVKIPPLRQRIADILPLARHFLHLLNRAPARTAQELTVEAEQALLAYDWPGNIRELQNVMERSLVMSGSDPITPEALGLTPSGSRPSGLSSGTLKEMEQRAILAALQAEGGNRRRAAKRLGIALRTLQYKLKEYGLGDKP